MNKLTVRKRLYLFIMAMIILTVEMGIVSYVWVKYYNTELPKAYFFWGHVFISVVYFAILLLVSVMYGGLKIGSYRMIELMFSQGFSTLLADIIFYAIIVLLAYHFPTPLPLIIGMILQVFLIGVWILLATYGFRALFPPIDMLLIYSGDKELFESKVRTRRHQFKITEAVSAAEDMSILSEAVSRHDAVVLWDVKASKRDKIFKMCYEKQIEIYVSPKITDIVLKGANNLHFFDTPLLLVNSSPIQPEQVIIKRCFDLIFAILILIVASPFMILTAICVKCYDNGSILYKQIRCTVDGKEYYIYKFRSMREDAEKDGKARLSLGKNDDRVTPVGRFIRRTRLDELPQLFNVIKGDMSFVGPRPERPEIIAQYKKAIPEFVYRMKVKAGITGYAQIYGKYNTLPYDKLKLDLFYIENYSIWLDIKLIILTVKTLFKFDSTEGVSQGMVTPISEEDNE